MRQLFSVRMLALFFLILIGGGKTWAVDTITLSGTKLTLDCATTNKTGTLTITATKTDGSTVSGLTYTYESNNEAVATVDNGTVTAVMAGNATITVSFAGSDQYDAATCTVNVVVKNSSVTSETKVYHNIAEVQDAAQSTITNETNGSVSAKSAPKIDKCALVFEESNPATVVAVFANNDPDIDGGKEGAGYFFIVDKSNRGLMIPKQTDKKYFDFSAKELKVGSTFTGTLVGTYTEKDSRIPAFNDVLSATQKIGEDKTEYTSSITVNHDGEATDTKEAVYPINEVKDVHALAETNNTVTDGDISKASYGPYLNTIVSVTGTIKENNEKTSASFYLVQNENTVKTDETNRIYLNSSQITGVNMTDYVGTTGTFEGILIKRNNSEPKLVILKANFFEISKIYIDENDDENRIHDLVKTGALDDEVDIYVHRTKLVNTAGAWNTLCFPFDLTKDEFKTAFGCELTDLAAANTGDNNVNENGDLLFTKVEGLSISAGVPYIMKASGTQQYSTNTSLTLRNTDSTVKSPSEMISEDDKYYAHIGKKKISIVPPKEVEATFNNSIVNGKFYFRGLYGQKKYTNDENGNLTETPIADNGSQKYQYISTAEGNYLKYLPATSTLAFNGLRAYFYFPNWKKENNNSQNNNNAKIHIALDGGTSAIDHAFVVEEENEAASSAIYNLNGQKVDSSYKGVVIRNGKKMVIK